MDEDLIRQARLFVYNHFAQTARPPSAADAGAHFGLDPASAQAVYAELHRRHALLLDPATDAIRMAWPFSGVPTGFVVRANGLSYWANCAWDSLGIPAALGCEAEIDAYDAWSGDALRLAVRAGEAVHSGEHIHFLEPFARWYDDLVFT